MLIFDMHQIVKNFINAGFTEQQAEAVTNEQKRIIESNGVLATLIKFF